MNRIEATRINEIDWTKRFVEDSDIRTLLTESTEVRKPDGSLLVVFLKNSIQPEINAHAWKVLKKYNPRTDNRPVATGIGNVARKRKDGTFSKAKLVPKGWSINSGIVGHFERTARMPYAHSCAWNQKHPDKFAHLFPLVSRVNDLYKINAGERWHAQNEVAHRTNPAWLIAGSVFTTLTINKNFRTACHKDAGDLPQGFGCISVIKEGLYKGGYLTFPNFGVGVDLQMGDLLLFDPHEFHGNTQLIKLTPETQRCSIVYYYREMLQYCQSPTEELAFAKNRKLGEPLFDPSLLHQSQAPV